MPSANAGFKIGEHEHQIIVSRLVPAVILQAVYDLERARPQSLRSQQVWIKCKINALIWLASRAASPWFQLANIDQETALRRINWSAHARYVLKYHMVTNDVVAFIRNVLAILGEENADYQ